MTSEQKLRQALLLILDQIDYSRHACSPTDMVGACLDVKVLDIVHKALEETK
jgi:hypothetical protein